MKTCGAAGGTPDRFGGLFKVTLNVIVIVLLGGNVNPDPVPLIGKVPPTGMGAAAVRLKFSVFSFELRAWCDLLTSALCSLPSDRCPLISDL